MNTFLIKNLCTKIETKTSLYFIHYDNMYLSIGDKLIAKL